MTLHKIKQVCKRCGRCCIDVGRTFWKTGSYEDIEELNKLAHNGDHEDNGLPCEMLSFDCDRTAVCRIQEIYGYDAKPTVCKEHQGDERCCL